MVKLNKINEKILFLTISDQSKHPINNYLDCHCNYDFINWECALHNVFKSVITYDFFCEFVKRGTLAIHDDILEIIQKEKPKYLLWPSMSYEISEETFIEVRQHGTKIIGCFFDDIMRFQSYSMFFTHLLDYIITFDSKDSVNLYKNIGSNATFLMALPSKDFYKKNDYKQIYDVSFVGAKIADREKYIHCLRDGGFNVKAFGRGWSSGYISTQKMIKVFNSSKINLCFIKTVDNCDNVQLKARLFEICMSGGFLLTEYAPILENYFIIDKEIACFKGYEEAIRKIKYYLKNEEKRMSIAIAGYKKTRKRYCLELAFTTFFNQIEKDIIPAASSKKIKIDQKNSKIKGYWHLNASHGWFMLGNKSEASRQLKIAKNLISHNRKYMFLKISMALPYIIGLFIMVVFDVLSKIKGNLSRGSN